MQYLCLIYEAESNMPNRPPEEQEAIMSEYLAFTNAMQEQGKLVAGDALMPTETATTIRIRDGGKSGAGTNGNSRLYDPAVGEWVGTFFSAPAYSSSIWRGKMEGERLVLRRPQKAPGTDLDGFSTLTFSGVSAQGFDWLGASIG